MNQYPNALKEIVKNQQKLKKSIEFKELTAIYYIKTKNYKKSLNILEKIPYNKREFSIHKEIILCFLILNQYKDSLSYIDKIEKKAKSMDERKILGEFYLLKAITKIFLNNLESAVDDLNKATALNPDFKSSASKLLLYSNIILDNPSEIFKTIENISGNEILINDAYLLKNIGNYFIYKNDYQKSLYVYSQLEKIKDLNKEELMVLADLYYHTNDFNSSIETIENLFENYYYRSPELYKNLSLLFGKNKDYNNELFFLKEGLNNYKDDQDFYVRLAKLYLDKNEPLMALQYINEAKEIYDNNKNIPYDKRLDILYILALQQSNKTFSEKELLNLREKESDNIEYYLQIIKYYLDSYKFSEAKRELDAALKLQLDDEQTKILNTIQVILALYTNNNENYQKAKKELFDYQNKNIYDNINIAIINLFENNYNEALEILNSINIYSSSNKIQNKVLYLKSLCYFYKGEYKLSFELINKILEKKPANIKASYLKNLINKKFGVIE